MDHCHKTSVHIFVLRAALANKWYHLSLVQVNEGHRDDVTDVTDVCEVRVK